MYWRMLAIVVIGVVLAAGLIPDSGAAVSFPRAVSAQSDPLADCAALLAEYQPVTGPVRITTPEDIPLPPVRQAWLDQAFNTCMIRVTDRHNDFDAPQNGLKNEYSRVQAFNADETLIMVRSVDGDWFLYDALSLEPVHMFGFAMDEPRWDAQNPYRFTYSLWFDGLLQVMIADLVPSGAGFDVMRTVAHDFTGELPPEWNGSYVWRRWEGSPSSDSRYDVFMVEDQDFVTRGLIVYDWQQDLILGQYTVPNAGQNEPDNVGMSTLGTYALAQFEPCESSTLGTYADPCGAMVYTRDLTDGWGVASNIGHNDVALDVQGREVVVFQDSRTDQIVMADLATGDAVPLLDLDFSGGIYGLHISGQATHRPGWIAVSVHPEAPSLDFSNPFWMVGSVFALELTAEPRIVQLAHHHSIRSGTEEDYFAEPQVTVNHDFTHLLFASNWEQYGTGEVEMYLVVLPDNWLEHMP